MRLVFVSICLFLSLMSWAQQDVHLWTEVGVKAKLTKKTDLGLEWSNRFDVFGLKTTFPQVSIKYKVYKWLRPSIDYRWVSKRDKYGNYLDGHRMNANLNLVYSKKRFETGIRLRYQYAFNSFSENYEPEFDNAYRIKSYFDYNIKKSIFKPSTSLEFFYNPENSELGKRFNKMRFFIGTELDLKGPHKVELGYIYDQRINLPKERIRHIASLSYTYKFNYIKYNKLKNEPVKKERNKMIKTL